MPQSRDLDPEDIGSNASIKGFGSSTSIKVSGNDTSIEGIRYKFIIQHLNQGE